MLTMRCVPEVEPASRHPRRFRDNPLVTGPPHIRFYAGAPLVTTEGYRLGSLCVIDPEPRTFDVESCNLLCNFAEMVVREIEKEKFRVRCPLGRALLANCRPSGACCCVALSPRCCVPLPSLSSVTCNGGLLFRLQVSESVKLQSQTNSLMRAMDAFREAIMLVDMEEGRWTVMFTNDAWLSFMGAPRPVAPAY